MVSLSIYVAGLLFVGAAVCAGWLLAYRNRVSAQMPFADTEANVVHLIMNTGMGLMLTSLMSAGLHTFILYALVITAAGLLVKILLVLRHRSRTRPKPVAGTVYHLIALLAMIYAGTLGMHSGVVSELPNAMHHAHVTAEHIAAGHLAAGHAQTMQHTASPDWKMQLLGAVFLIDGLMLALLTFLFPQAFMAKLANIAQQTGEGKNAEGVSLRSLQISSLPHLIMDAGMVYMLWVPASMG